MDITQELAGWQTHQLSMNCKTCNTKQQWYQQQFRVVEWKQNITIVVIRCICMSQHSVSVVGFYYSTPHMKWESTCAHYMIVLGACFWSVPAEMVEAMCFLCTAFGSGWPCPVVWQSTRIEDTLHEIPQLQIRCVLSPVTSTNCDVTHYYRAWYRVFFGMICTLDWQHCTVT